MSVNKILAEFAKLGYQKESLVTKKKINQLLNQLFKKNASAKIKIRNSFDQDVADQIWQMCYQNQNQQVQLKEFVQVIQKAQISLLRKIQQLRQKKQGLISQKKKHEESLARAKQKNQQKTIKTLSEKINRQEYQIQSIAQEIQGYLLDSDMVTLPFESDINFTISKLEFKESDSQTKKNLYGEAKSHVSGKSGQGRSRIKEQVYQTYPTQKQYNTKLTVILYLVLLLIVLELLAGIKKYNFLNFICCFSLISIFTLGYFDSRYNKFIIVGIAFTQFWDIIWLTVQANVLDCLIQTWLNPGSNSSLSTLNNGALKFYIVMAIIIMFLKLVIAFLLFGFRNSIPQEIFYVKIYKNYEITIGKLEGYQNPITEYLIKIFQKPNPI